LSDIDEPLDAESWYLRGRKQVANGDGRAAVGSYTRALEVESSHVKAQHARGLAFQSLGEHAAAIEDVTDVIRRFDSWPGSYLAFCNRAVCLQAIGNLGDAIDDCGLALARNANQIDALYLRGTLLKRKGQFADAVRDLDTVIELDSSYSEAYFVRGMLRQEQGQWNEAISDISLFLNCADSTKEAQWQCYMVRGVASFELGDNKSAIEDLTAACKLSPQDEHAYLRRSEVYRAIGELSKAEDDFNTGKALLDSRDADASTLPWAAATMDVGEGER
jgi:tetratricopeptide (TPR) repeat protein